MEPTYTIIESPDNGGYYARFHDALSGNGILKDGKPIETSIYAKRFQAVKEAKRILGRTDWTKTTIAKT